MKHKAATPAEYLSQLPEERRAAIQAVRHVILKHLPKGYKEVMQYGMIGYVVPLQAFPAGYLNRKNEPLPYAGLASQKHYMALYLSVHGDKAGDAWFRKAYKASGKKLDMGRSCVRFKKLDDLPLDVIGEAIARVPMKKWIAICATSWKKRHGGA